MKRFIGGLEWKKAPSLVLGLHIGNDDFVLAPLMGQVIGNEALSRWRALDILYSVYELVGIVCSDSFPDEALRLALT